MATLASTNLTSAITGDNSQPIAFGEGGLLIEVFDCAGGSVDDTVALTPRWISDVRIVLTNACATDNLSHTAANTSATLTLKASAATTLTFMAVLIGRR